MLNCGLIKTYARKASLYLCISVALFLLFGMSCTHSTDKTEPPPQPVSETKTEVVIKQSWRGDYPVDQLEVLSENAEQKGKGYIGDPKMFSAVWAAFKPGESEPDIDFDDNLVIFVRNIQYYNRISIGKVFLKNGVAEVIAMETLSARPIEEKVAMSLAVISREGVHGIQTRDGVIKVEGRR